MRREHDRAARGPLGNPIPHVTGARGEGGHVQTVAAGRGENGEGQRGIDGERLHEGLRLAVLRLLPWFEPCEQHQAALPFIMGAASAWPSGASVMPSNTVPLLWRPLIP